MLRLLFELVRSLMTRVFSDSNSALSSEISDSKTTILPVDTIPVTDKEPGRVSPRRKLGKIKLKKIIGLDIVAGCGHPSAEEIRMHVYGADLVVSGIEKCPSCLQHEARQTIIRCVCCGLPIIPGEAVALYRDNGKFRFFRQGTKVEDAFVGCLRFECCPSGAYFAGHWEGRAGFQPCDFSKLAKTVEV